MSLNFEMGNILYVQLSLLIANLLVLVLQVGDKYKSTLRLQLVHVLDRFF